MAGENECALCTMQFGPNKPETSINGKFRVTCRRCGMYEITGSLLDTLPDSKEYKDKRYLISGRTRTYFELTGKPLLLTTYNFESIISSAPTTVLDRKMALIKFIADKSDHIGKEVEISIQNDYPVAFLKNAEEFNSFLSHIRDQGLMEFSGGGLVALTLEGWEEYEHLQKSPVESNQVFLAMKFPKKDPKVKIDISLIDAYENGFIPGIEDTGHDCLRIDQKQHNRKICEEILYEIKQSKFLVADVTGQRGGVYFEAGYATSLGMEVIWTCHESDTDNIHFDTRQYNRISWKDAEDLRDQLKNRIFGTVGRGKNEVKPD